MILREVRRQRQEVYIPLIHRPGEEAQVDFFEVTVEVGAQALTPGYGQPAVTFNLFPLNLQYDVNDVLTLQIGAGMAGTLDLNTGRVTAGPQLTFGLNFKLGQGNRWRLTKSSNTRTCKSISSCKGNVFGVFGGDKSGPRCETYLAPQER